MTEGMPKEEFFTPKIIERRKATSGEYCMCNITRKSYPSMPTLYLYSLISLVSLDVVLENINDQISVKKHTDHYQRHDADAPVSL